MKATVNAKELKDAVTWTSKVIGRPVLPILDCVLLTAEGDVLTVRATDLENDVTRRVPATVEEAGQVAVEAKALKNCLGKMGRGSVALSTHTDPDKKLPWLVLEAGGFKSSFPTPDPEDFPLDTARTDWDHALALYPDDLRLKHILNFVHKDRHCVRPVLHSLFIEVYARKFLLQSEDLITHRFRLTAADGFRLVTTQPVDSEVVASYLLPYETVRLVAGLGNGVLRLKAVGHAEYVSGSSIVRSMLAEGTFPNYDQVIPRIDAGQWASFGTAGFAEALRGLAAVADPDNHMVKLDLDDDKATLSCDYEDRQASTEIGVEWGDGEFAISFDAKLMLGCLALCGERARIMFQEAYPSTERADGSVARGGYPKPMLVEGDGCQMVLMPMDMR